MPDQEPCWGSDSFSVWPVRSKIRFKRLWRPCHFLENPGFLCYFWFLWHLIKQYFCLLLYLTSSIQAGLSNISLQRSRPLHSFDYCFCHVFLQSVSVALIPAILNPQLISICVSHKEKKKKRRRKNPAWNTICFLLSKTSKTHHKFTSCHVRVSVLLRINFSMETCTSVIQDRNALRLGRPCVRRGGGCREGKCDRQTNGRRLFGTCVSQAPVVSWHVYISNHSQIAVGANRHLQLFMWPLPHK